MQPKYLVSLLFKAILAFSVMFSFFFGNNFSWAYSDQDPPLIFMPFEGGTTWRVSQYPNQTGNYSHQNDLAWAYDFVSADGNTLGKNIVSPVNGVVVNSGYSGDWGNRIVIRSTYKGDHFYVLIAHMRYAPLVGVNSSVKQGQLIGYVGNTGHSTGPHVHIQVQRSNVYPNQKSIPFDFVEGKANSSNLMTSMLYKQSGVFDKYDRVNGGQFLGIVDTDWGSSNWRSISNSSFSGSYYNDYFRSNGTNDWFEWSFWVDTPGNYMLYSGCPRLTSFSTDVEVSWSGPGVSATGNFNQRYSSYSTNGLNGSWRYIGYYRVNTRGRHFVKFTNYDNAGTYMCADAIFLRQL